MKTTKLTIEVPKGKYCAKFFDMGGKVKSLDEDEWHPNIVLIEQCPLLKVCESCSGGEKEVKKRTYYCPIFNNDSHMGKDDIGILKHHHKPYERETLPRKFIEGE